MKTLKRKLHEEKGMTLIEIVVAMGIFSISVLTIMMMYRFNYFSNVDYMRRTIATNLARQGIESQREAALNAQDKSFDGDPYSSEGVTYSTHYDIDYNSGDGTYDIKVTVTWKNAFGKDENVILKLLRI